MNDLAARIRQAQALFQSGRAAEALALLSDLARAHPKVADVHLGLGTVLLSTGRVDDGVKALTTAVALQPGNLQARLNLAQALMHAGRFAEAEPHLAKVAAKQAGNPEILGAYASCLRAAGELGTAETTLRKARKAAPGHPKIAATLADVLVQRDKAADAVPLYREAVAAIPDNGPLRYNLAIALERAGDIDGAVGAYRAALDRAPDLVDAHNNLGNLLANTGRLADAVEHLRAAVRLAPEAAPPRVNLARTLLDMDDAEEAVSIYRDTVERWPPETTADATTRAAALDALSGLATAAMFAGDPAEADRWIDRLLAADPGSARARWQRVRNGHIDLSDDEIAEMATLAGDAARVPASERAQLWFALGRVHDARDAIDAAFAAYAQANAVKNAGQPADTGDTDRALADRILAATPRAALEGLGSEGSADERPVFVVGMPRSGTTLIEQMIAAHPLGAGAGELPTLTELARALKDADGRPYPDGLGGLTAGDRDQAARTYLTALTRGRDEARRIVDKMPDNYWLLGLAAVLFPKARVIHARRDPMAVGLSIFQQNFVGTHPYAYDLARIGRRIRLHDRLMEHWKAELPLPVLTLDYETLVAEPEAQTRAIATFLDLPWDEAMLRFHEKDSLVRTASSHQVRKAVYTGSIERWRAYEPHLAPLAEALAEG